MRKALVISPENYLRVKEKYENRLSRMIDFADSDERCRSVMLLDYFGEESSPCGKCDVCRKKADGSNKPGEFENICGNILSELGKTNQEAHDLVKLLGFPEEKTIEAIRYLLDSDFVRTGTDKRLYLNPGKNSVKKL